MFVSLQLNLVKTRAKRLANGSVCLKDKSL